MSLYISTHAPRVGGDLERQPQPFSKLQISTHAPRVGGDKIFFVYFKSGEIFQPTPPVWGATAFAQRFGLA